MKNQNLLTQKISKHFSLPPSRQKTLRILSADIIYFRHHCEPYFLQGLLPLTRLFGSRSTRKSSTSPTRGEAMTHEHSS